MERNAHRLTLHSPAEKSLPQLCWHFIDADQHKRPFISFRSAR